MRECTEAHARSPTGASYESLLEARRLLPLHFAGLTHSEMKKQANTVFAEGDKNGKLLAMLVPNCDLITNIPVVRDRGGAMVTDPLLIMQEFVNFFSPLYPPFHHMMNQP